MQNVFRLLANSFEKFVEEMRKLNTLYTPTLLEEFWDGYVHSQEDRTVRITNREQAIIRLV
jgi:hypothetical protein